MAHEEPTDYCRLSCFRDTNGCQPLYAVVCDNDFPISHRLKYCLNSCRAHYNYKSGYVSLYCDNPGKQIKVTNENYIHGIFIDPETLLKNFGEKRFAISSRLEKEGRGIVTTWNKLYGPNGKEPNRFGMPKSVLFKVCMFYP